MDKRQKKQRRKKAINDAMEAIATGLTRYSCIAIQYPQLTSMPHFTGTKLVKEYREFYQKYECKWDPELPTNGSTPEATEWRLMLMAFFAEVGLEGINR